jgi:hypothetical protein
MCAVACQLERNVLSVIECALEHTPAQVFALFLSHEDFFRPMFSTPIFYTRNFHPAFLLAACDHCLSDPDIPDRLLCLEIVVGLRALTAQEVAYLFERFDSGRALDVLLRCDDASTVDRANDLLMSADAQSTHFESDNAVHYLKLVDPSSLAEEIARVDQEQRKKNVNEMLEAGGVFKGLVRDALLSTYNLDGISPLGVLHYAWTQLGKERREAFVADCVDFYRHEQICGYGIIVNVLSFVGAALDRTFFAVSEEVVARDARILELRKTHPPDSDFWLKLPTE